MKGIHEIRIEKTEARPQEAGSLFQKTQTRFEETKKITWQKILTLPE
jgi:hypothetical protein